MLARTFILLAVAAQTMSGAIARCVCIPIAEPGARADIGARAAAGCCMIERDVAEGCGGDAADGACCGGVGSGGCGESGAYGECCDGCAPSGSSTGGAPETECAACCCLPSGAPTPEPAPLGSRPSVSVDLISIAPGVALELPAFQPVFACGPPPTVPRAAASHNRRQATLSVWLN